LLAATKPKDVSLSTGPFIDAVWRFSGEKRPKVVAGKTNSATANAAVGAKHIDRIVAAKRNGSSTSVPANAVAAHEHLPPEAVHVQVHTRFKNTSDYAKEPLSDDAIKTIHKFLAETPQDSSCLQFDSYGGAINRVGVKDSAFCHRGDTLFCMHYQINWRHATE